MAESESNQLTTWSKEVASDTEEVVRSGNQIRYYELQAEQLQKMIDVLKVGKRRFLKILVR